jgi:hypothetical protein
VRTVTTILTQNFLLILLLFEDITIRSPSAFNPLNKQTIFKPIAPGTPTVNKHQLYQRGAISILNRLTGVLTTNIEGASPTMASPTTLTTDLSDLCATHMKYSIRAKREIHDDTKNIHGNTKNICDDTRNILQSPVPDMRLPVVFTAVKGMQNSVDPPL